MKTFLQYLTESKLLEGKQEFLKKYSSEPDVKDLVSKFWIIRQRLNAPQNDIDWWIKQPYDEFKKFVVGFDVSKNKSARKQDNYAKEAENWGAVMFGKFGSYEAWFVPTHEAAVQLGRFYKGVSTKWCISTDNSEYFNDNYHDSEFIFLISDDKLLNEYYQKLALQLNTNKDLEAVWDADDNNIFDDIPEFLEQPINDALYEFNKLNRSKNDKITKSIVDKNEEVIKTFVQDKLKTVKIIDHDTIPEKYKKYVTSIIIPNSIKKIGQGAFSSCESLQSITIPNSVIEIGKWAFSDCSSLQSITISNSVTKIGQGAFSRCKSLQSITIPNSVIEIGEGTFYFCESLQSITIPNSVTKIGEQVFLYCSSLKQVIFSSNSLLLDQIKKGKYKDWGLTKNQIFIKK